MIPIFFFQRNFITENLDDFDLCRFIEQTVKEVSTSPVMHAETFERAEFLIDNVFPHMNQYMKLKKKNEYYTTVLYFYRNGKVCIPSHIYKL